MDLVQENKFETISIDSLVPAAWNYKDEDTALSEKLAENLKRNGQIENIIVRELDTGAFEVVNGNHRYQAMKALGAKKVYAFNLGKISDAAAYRIAIETNETKFRSDTLKLGDLMQDIVKEFDVSDLVETLPYTNRDIELMSEMDSFSWDQFKDESDEESSSSSSTGNVIESPLDSGPSYQEMKLALSPEIADHLRKHLNHIKTLIRSTDDSAAMAVVCGGLDQFEDNWLSEVAEGLGIS